MPIIEEKLGSFYLGKKYDLDAKKLLDDQVHYDSKDLVTHALCVGMTGSGKTGLCLSLLEEAAIDGVPVLCIDPKGDLGNLLLTFPNLDAADFQPWVDMTDPNVVGETSEAVAKTVADRWAKGIANWGMLPDRIRKLRETVDMTIYTPGSSIGVPLTVLKSFDAPPAKVRDDAETMREKIASAASGLLTLLGMDADPLTSREHILISNILADAWGKGADLSLEDLIRSIQVPPIKRVGVVDLESFFPAADRAKFSMSLNNLLASPAFAGWLQGQAVDIKDLLYTSEGKPRLSIISIAHLNDSERMFFVTILLGELLSWMRAQPGTGSLRAIFYMDEVYGYFPPSAKPPSKPPMLTLLKQARAFGLGIVLATQNPVDLDYKGLANMGTWFLGRLQTQRDKDRVLDGLEGASLQQGAAFDRASMERKLSALGNRVFLMNNVHDDGPTIFQTRWALSYLRGPLSREQISSLMASKRQNWSVGDGTSSPNSASGDDKSPSVLMNTSGKRPIVPADVQERFLLATKVAGAKTKLLYRPALLGLASVHFVKSANGIDAWQEVNSILHLGDEIPESLWEEAETIDADALQLSQAPEDGFTFADLPAEMTSAKNYSAWDKALKEHLFRHEKCTVYYCAATKQTSAPGVSEQDARIELAHAAKEARDDLIAKLKSKYADKLRSLQAKLTTAQQRVERHAEDAKAKRMDGILEIGTTILGALLGNKITSSRTVSKTATVVRDLGKATAKQGDAMRAQETVEEILANKEELESQCREEIDQITNQFSVENLALEAIDIPLRKADTKVKQLSLVWVPWQIDAQGIATRLVN